MPSDPPLASALDEARTRTDELFHIVDRAAYYDRPIPERHRIIFYLGHLEAFDWNLICRAALGMPSFQATFDRLFAFGIDPPVGELPQDQPRDWPAIEEVERYNTRVREQIDRALAHAPAQTVHVAMEHRLMHAETLAYLMHWLPLEAKAGRQEAVTEGPPAQEEFVEIPAGTATLGRRRDAGFGWDNEFDEHTVHVPGFRIGKCKLESTEFPPIS